MDKEDAKRARYHMYEAIEGLINTRVWTGRDSELGKKLTKLIAECEQIKSDIVETPAMKES